MYRNVKKQTFFEIASKFSTTDKLLETNLCYVREKGETNTITYLATRNFEITTDVVGELEEREGINLGLDLNWALNEYNKVLAESDGLQEAIIRISHNSVPLYIDTIELDVRNKGVQIVSVSEIVVKHSDLTEKLKAGNVLITYHENGKHKVLHTTLSNKILWAWVANGRGSEVYEVQRWFEQGSDMGVVTLPDLDNLYPSCRHINLLDVLEVRLID